MSNETDIFLIDEEIEIKKREMKLHECLKLIEKVLILKSERYGKTSTEFIKTGKQLCEVCNLIAINLVEKNKQDEGLFYLEKAEKLFTNYSEIYNISLNNLGCFFIMTKNYEKAVIYLEKALNIAIRTGSKIYSAETYLNMSTVFSRISNYKLGIEMCLNCIIILQELLTDSTEKIDDEQYATVINILIISYRNLAVLHDNSNDYHNALLYYKLSETLFKEFVKLPVSNTILKGNVTQPQIIDNSYTQNIIIGLSSKSKALFKTNMLIGKEGKDYYNSYLTEIGAFIKAKIEENEEKISDESHEMQGMNDL